MKYFWLLIFLFPFLSEAQEHFVFSRIDYEQGLFDNRIRCLNQLQDGRMVVITEGLINFYNGIYFKSLHYNEECVYPLEGYSGFHHSYVDNAGYLWIKNQHKLLLFDVETEYFVTEIEPVLEAQGMKKTVRDLFMDMNFDFWYLTKDDDLYYRKSGENDVRHFLQNASVVNQKKELLFDLAVCENRLYLFYKSGTIICYDLLSGREISRDNPFVDEERGKYSNTIMVVPYKQYLYQVRNGASGGIIHRYNIKSGRWEEVLKTDIWLNTLTIDKTGSCWMSSQKGIWQISQDLQNKRFLTKLELVGGKEFKTEISTQFNDKDGGLWIGTFNRGLLYYHPDRFKFQNYGKVYFGVDDDQELRFQCISEKDGSALLGTQNGLYRFSVLEQKFTLFPGLPKHLNCIALFRDSDNSIWLSTENNRLYEIADEIRQFKLPFNIRNFTETETGQLLLGTNVGLYSFDRAFNTWKPYEIYDENKLNVWQFVSWGKDTLIGISAEKLFVFDKSSNTLSFPSNNNSNKLAMFKHSNHQYNCLFVDSRGLLWFGTQDGLNIWEPDKKVLRRFYMENGLVNNVIKSIIEDPLGRIWVSTSNGISLVNIDEDLSQFEYSFTNFNRFDGIIENEFLPRATYLSLDGHLFWGGLDGFNEIDLNSFGSTNQNELKPLITKFSLSGTEILQGMEYDGDVLLQKAITTTHEIELKYNQNFFSFNFSALNYINPMRTYYRYMLEGVNENWINVTTNVGLGTAVYTKLSPGNYTFKVAASNKKNQWNNKITQLSITIRPPLWKTTFAYIFYMVLVMGFTLFVLTMYSRKNRQKMQRIQKEEFDQMKLAFFTNISHELKTPLALIITPLSSILKKISDVELKSQLKLIYFNANELLSQVNQLLDFRKMEIKGEYLQLSYCDIQAFLAPLLNTFNELVKGKEIELVWDFRINDLRVYIDQYKLKLIVSNLLSNAYKFTSNGGKISLLATETSMNNGNIKAFKIEVKDSGCGIPAKEHAKIFDRFYQVGNQSEKASGSGIGLHMVKEYIHLHNGLIELESEPEKGSKFTITIPSNLKPIENVDEKEEDIGNSNPTKILIVEDNSEFREFLSNELSLDYNVVKASDGEDGYEQAIKHEPDLIISDLMMPGLNGLQLCQRLKSNVQVSHIPVIILTAKSSEEAQFESFEVKADAFITKPFNMSILLLRINNLIEQNEQRKLLFKKAVMVNPGSLTTTSIDEELIKKALELIQNNMDNAQYSVDQLSKDMCMDRTGLYRKLVAIVGQTPSEFIRSVRLKGAAQLLEQGTPVSEVADLVGFNTMSYFGKCFHEEFGVKPSKYKK